jgi:DNA-binding CsgD family transcriptional regulator
VDGSLVVKTTPSKRDIDVIWLMGEGMSNQEIGDCLGISRNSVKTVVSRIAVKLNVNGTSSSRAASVRQAMRKNWMT